jgi:hypothetical protein
MSQKNGEIGEMGSPLASVFLKDRLLAKNARTLTHHRGPFRKDESWSLASSISSRSASQAAIFGFTAEY